MSLTTSTKVKDFLGILTVTKFDTLINTLILSIDEFLVSQCKTELEETVLVDELYDGKGDDLLFLKNKHITAISKLEVRSGGTIGDPTYTEISTDDYTLVMGQDHVYYPAGFTCNPRYYRVNYTCGYPAPLPEDLEMLATKLVARVFGQSKSQGKSSESIDGASVNWAKKLDVFDMPTISKYKNTYR